VLATSAATGSGLGALRSLLVERGAAGVQDLGGPWRAALGAARDAVQRARERADLGAELVAVELQSALRALDAIDGRHSPEHLLDRIYGRFCLGK
jgi:tRNA U34 5-carboxymethylaminomethyl modifying GTPase MnmE/TrmE